MELRTLIERLLGISTQTTRSRTREWTLYALKCQEDTYYIGITSIGAKNRYRQHKTGQGAGWTKRHPPAKMLWSRPMGYMSEGEAVKIETATTLHFISLYGVDYVRGGKLVRVASQIHRAQYRTLVVKR